MASSKKSNENRCDSSVKTRIIMLRNQTVNWICSINGFCYDRRKWMSITIGVLQCAWFQVTLLWGLQLVLFSQASLHHHFNQKVSCHLLKAKLSKHEKKDSLLVS